jgi:LmbE family N-acetylglucosaminyl deacetylase
VTILDDVPARALAIYAHPDDPEVSCGGTLAGWAAAGAEVHVVIACRGEKGSSDPDADPVAVAAQRAEEVAAAAAALGLAGVDLLGHPDGDLDGLGPALRAELVGLVRAHRPDTVVCPDPTAVLFGDGYVNHVDHRAIGWAAIDAVAPAAASPHYFPDRGPAHQVSTLLLTGTLEPDVWVDVGASLDAKVAALFHHRTQLGHEGGGDWLDDFVRHRAEDEGRRAGVTYAESFRRIRFQR